MFLLVWQEYYRMSMIKQGTVMSEVDKIDGIYRKM